jgi:hypothetical protein
VHRSNRKAKEEGAAHDALPPYQRRTASRRILRHQAGGGPCCCSLGLGFLAVTIATQVDAAAISRQERERLEVRAIFSMLLSRIALVMPGSRTLRPTTCSASCRKTGANTGQTTGGQPGVFAHMRC